MIRWCVMRVLSAVLVLLLLALAAPCQAGNDEGMEEYGTMGGGAVSSGDAWVDPVTGMEFVKVWGGCYMMGSNTGDADEKPVHEVCMDDFWIGKYEVTRGQFRQFVDATGYKTDGERRKKFFVYNASTNWSWKLKDGYSWRNVGHAQNDRHPATGISWNDTQAYISWLNRQSSARYRLPWEAEWEYAARGGSSSKWSWGDQRSQGCQNANAKDTGNGFSDGFPCNDGYKFTAPVGSYYPNGFGLYDMLGNVWEWCDDEYSEKAYSRHARQNPRNVGGGKKVVRGGAWFNPPKHVRTANRSKNLKTDTGSFIGFRLIRVR